MWFRTLFDSLKPGPACLARQGASRRRPAPCLLPIEALDDRIVPASLSVGDATIIEGNAGTQYAEVRVTLDAPTNKTVTVNYDTADGSATTAANDYEAQTGKLTFAPGETAKTITIEIKGDSRREADESFNLDLYGLSSNGLFTKSRGVGSILNDD